MGAQARCASITKLPLVVSTRARKTSGACSRQNALAVSSRTPGGAAFPWTAPAGPLVTTVVITSVASAIAGRRKFRSVAKVRVVDGLHVGQRHAGDAAVRLVLVVHAGGEWDAAAQHVVVPRSLAEQPAPPLFHDRAGDVGLLGRGERGETGSGPQRVQD